MRTLLKILLGSLLLVLIVALGTEVVALHRIAPALTAQTAPVVVRKSTTAPVPPKTVRPVATHRPPCKLRKTALPIHHNAPAN
ncbi:hypothetical protein KB206_09660 [Microvirga sp. STS02]|uniref:hypothetical protein n=1 Tax=Hymenobacter negativus TaxID=2795026 RepID=UPI0018DD3EC1|nr:MULTISPECIES: hypothetical protein [Bacteria]MBH8569148.1 hypothetical protein [Hymenobacter negativus]MBR7208883.1 hypothetical protein [Microvirga sp. STS02]